MKKIISTSLWGDNPKYCIGAIKNAELLPLYYPQWILKIYTHKDVDEKIITKLRSFKNTEIEIIDKPPDWTAMLWRFFPSLDESTECFICRDLDSRFNNREVSATNQWLLSDKSVHIMRDHPYHGFAMLGGMVGFKRKSFKIINECLKNFNPSNKYGTDYEFFHNILYKNINNDTLVHDEFFEKKPFPIKRNGYEFVGQVFDEQENTVKEHLEIIKNYINNENKR